MADENKVDAPVHPIHIPDGLARFRQADSSVEGGGEEPWNPDERKGFDTPYDSSRGAAFRGGGMGADSMVEEHLSQGALDPEVLALAKEHNLSGDGRSFQEWLSDGEAVRLDGSVVSLEDYLPKRHPSKEKTLPADKNIFPLELKGHALSSSEGAPKEVRELVLAWEQRGDRRVQDVRIVKNEDGVGALQFWVSKDLSGVKEQIEISTDQFLKWFDGVKPLHDRYDSGRVIGLKFVSKAGTEDNFHPDRTNEKLANMVKGIRIGGIRLPKTTDVWVTELREFVAAKPPERKLKDKPRKEPAGVKPLEINYARPQKGVHRPETAPKLVKKEEKPVVPIKEIEKTSADAPILININDEKMQKFDDENGENKKIVDSFISAVPNAKEIRFVVKGKDPEAIETVVLTLKPEPGSDKRKTVEMPAFLMRSVFTNIKGKKNNGVPVGFELKAKEEGKKQMGVFISPVSGERQELLEKIVGRMVIGGNNFSSDIKVSMGRAEKGKAEEDSTTRPPGEPFINYPESPVTPHPGATKI